MATASPEYSRLVTLQESTPRYRAVTIRMEKGPPMLVADDVDVVRVRLCGIPHRNATIQGKEFNVQFPPGQSSAITSRIRHVEPLCFFPAIDRKSAMPSVDRYIYLGKIEFGARGRAKPTPETSATHRRRSIPRRYARCPSLK